MAALWRALDSTAFQIYLGVSCPGTLGAPTHLHSTSSSMVLATKRMSRGPGETFQ